MPEKPFTPEELNVENTIDALTFVIGIIIDFVLACGRVAAVDPSFNRAYTRMIALASALQKTKKEKVEKGEKDR